MIINKISLNNYRNIENAVIEPDKSVNVIYGDNAQGKTNIIEGIFIFSGSKSFRSNKDSDLIKKDAENKKSELEVEFSTKYDEKCGKLVIKDNRTCYINGIERTAGEMGDTFPVVVFSPKELNLIEDGPDERRRFLDVGLYQLKSSYGELMKSYRQALNQRNAVIRNIRAGYDVEESLDIWDFQLAFIGAKIIYQREKYIEKIYEYAKKFFSLLSENNEKLEMKIKKTCSVNEIEVGAINDSLYEKLKESRKKDVETGYTTCGPHRDDIEITIDGMNAKNFASQGQKRSAVIAIKMGEAFVLNDVYGEKPVVLLDDVLSELDERRQSCILNNIEDFQVFITCCDVENVSRLNKGKTFRISKGQITDVSSLGQ